MLLLPAAAFLAFLASWIVLPPFHRLLIPLAVGAPEVSPVLTAAAIAVALAAAVRTRASRRAWPALALAIVAAVVAISPIVRARSATRRFDLGMVAALGPGALDDAPPGRPRLRPSPVSVRDVFLGMTTGGGRVERNVRFAIAGGVDLHADVYQPVTAGPHPAVVQVYGGAWQRGAPGDYGRFAGHLASLGYVVFAVDYRHAPKWQWPAQMEDMRSAMRWIRDHGSRYGADLSRVAMIGRSAGAHLAMMAAYDRPIVPVKAVISFYGPTDLADGYRRPPRPDPFDIRAIEEALLGGSPDQVPAAYRDASPIARVGPASPPTLLLYGARDHIVHPRYGRLMHERLQQAGVPSVLLEIPGAEHAFDAVPNGPSAQIALYYVERFLARTMMQ